MKTDQDVPTASRRLVIFDLDYTLVSVNSSYHYLKSLYQKKILSFSTLLRAALIRFRFYLTPMTLEKLHHLVFDRMLEGYSLSVLEKHVDDFLEQLLPGSLYLPAFQELKAAQERGDYTALFSSSPDFLVQRFASYFKVDYWEGTVYGVDKEHRLCKITKLMVGTQKQRCLIEMQKRLGVSKEHVVVYSDSHDDLPLFLQAGEAVAVNPDRKLARIAKRHHWRVI